MNISKNRIVVVGGGTAGAISATYIKKTWGNKVEVVLIYDHSKPNIGIGESLTPTIYDYLNFVGITREELIRNVNATVKLGIKFKNWLNKNDEFYHSFIQQQLNAITPFNFEAAYDLISGKYDLDVCYGKDFFEQTRIPLDSNQGQSVHIDGVLFSKYIIEKFKNDLTIIDDVVTDVIVENQKINHLILERNGKISGNFYIDASGFSAFLFKHLSPEWVDKQDWLPLDSCIPNPIPTPNVKELPVCTLAEASEDGWILQVPLSNRVGAGYLYSSGFTSDEIALERFDSFLRKKYNSPLNDTFASGPGRGNKVLKFKSGYWKKQWIGNCLVIGLSSGFAEPLEATNIHQAVFQMKKFLSMYNFECFDFDINQYNMSMQEFYERVYLFIRFCYTGGRTDSEFWKYMTNNIPYEVHCLDQKIKKDILNIQSMSDSIFVYLNFTKIAFGLKKINFDSYEKNLKDRSLYEIARSNSQEIKKIKNDFLSQTVNHKKYIEEILN
jgi:tryptophan halogenase